MQTGIATTTLDLTGAERLQRLAVELGVESFGLNLMRLAPGQRGRIHAHARQEEVYVVLEGVVTVEVEGGERHDLGRGDAMRVAPALRRQLSNRGAVPAVLLALGGAEPHHRGDGTAFTAWDEAEGRPPQEVPLPEDLPPATP